MDTAKNYMQVGNGMTSRDIRMDTAKNFTYSNDVRMDTAVGSPTIKGGGLKLWERELLESSEVKRKATVAQLCRY
jgi:cell cycle protein kinase DBF2